MDKFHETKDLDLANATRGVWLVKVPKYVSDCWKTAERGSEVGKLIISKTKAAPGKQPEAVFSLSERLISESGGNYDEKLPSDHTFNLTGVGNQALSVLSVEMLASETGENTAGSAVLPYTEGKVCIEGKVIHRAECRPRIDACYMKLNQNRIEVGNKPKREIIQVDRAICTYKPKAAHESDIAYKLQKKEMGKKTRDDPFVVQQKLFGAFEKHQYYNIRDLVNHTQQPVTYLKEILREICDYKNKAPFKNMWELKPEYRHYGKPESSAK